MDHFGAWNPFCLPQPSSLLPLQMAYTLLQGLVMLALVARLVLQFNFHPKLGIMARTIYKAGLDLTHLVGVVLLLLCMLTVCVVIVIGHSDRRLSTFALTFQALLTYMTINQSNDPFAAALLVSGATC